ncbi:MAG: PEGA domain-containing protein [Lachnospiraceae bacterium]|nr:PEGA domain-containing protein [Lachnospiraceae bacterium]
MKRKLRFIPVILGLSLVFSACSLPSDGGGEPEAGYEDTGFMPATPGNYDSLDTAVYVGCDKEQKTIRFYNMEVGKYYTLNYDGATPYQDKYAQPIALDQLKRGSVVDISFMKGRKRLNSLQVNGEAFAFTDVENLLVTDGSRQVFLMGENYTLDQKAVILTADAPGEIMDLNAVDKLMVCGMGHTVYSISVQNGHGYLRLENDDHFVGGFIEIGDNKVYQISHEMLLAVPVGTYDVTVSNKGSTGTFQISVGKGQEITMDVSRYVSAPKYGKVQFVCTPEDAQLLIDGTAIDTAKDVDLSYGIHQMIAKADGYNTVTRYIRVAQDAARLSVVLEKGGPSTVSPSENSIVDPTSTPTPTPEPTPSVVSGDSASENGSSGDASSEGGSSESGGTAAYEDGRMSDDPKDGNTGGNSNNVITPGEYRVYIDAPEGVEVYKDGVYIGLTPISFKKAEGSCIVTLRKEGFQTRSYTITMDGEQKDVNYSFSELMPIG